MRGKNKEKKFLEKSPRMNMNARLVGGNKGLGTF